MLEQFWALIGLCGAAAVFWGFRILRKDKKLLGSLFFAGGYIVVLFAATMAGMIKIYWENISLILSNIHSLF